MVNTSESKKVLFRLKDGMKKDFSLAIVKADVGAQHVLEAFVEKVIAYDKGEDKSRAMKFLFSRATELQAEAKLQG